VFISQACEAGGRERDRPELIRQGPRVRNEKVSRTVEREDRLLRLIMAVLLVFTQYVGMSMAMPVAGRDNVATLLARIPICHYDDGSQSDVDHRVPTDNHSHDCDLCPACHIAASTAIPVPSASFLPLPSLIYLAKAEFAVPSTGPPGIVRFAAWPRGPPVTVV
jgi:hypothetical protein